MGRQFLLMRHAKSDWENPGERDHDRCLNERGRRVAPRMGEWMLQNGLLPDFVWCSTAERTRQTLDACLEQWAPLPVVSLDDQLYLASAGMLWTFLKTTPASAQRVLMVGHNPGLSHLVQRLAPESGEMPTAAVAAFELDEGVVWSDLDDAEVALKGFWRPRELGFE